MQRDLQDLQHATERLRAASPGAQQDYGILIADDDEGVRDVLAFGMQRSGFRVLSAPDGHSALELFRHHRDDIDLALLDVRMPGLDGPATFTRLRKLSPWLMCCFMSGDMGDYDAQVLRDLGAAAVFNKPFRVAEVSKVLLELVSRDPYQHISQVTVPETRRTFRQVS